jgi:uncharacterized protein (DUF433 family)
MLEGAMSHLDRITFEPGKRSGQPCIRKMRITVRDILEYMAGGMTTEEILADFPMLEKEDILAALEFAALKERRITQVHHASAS